MPSTPTVALQSIALVSGASNKIGDDFPQVQSLAITPESVKKHHTEKYYTDFGFAVRRGCVDCYQESS